MSNHGGRQLDHGKGGMAVLPEIVEAVKGRAEIIVDGGFLRGADIVKAMALGADAVGIGRLQGLAMAAGGEVWPPVRMIELLKDEVTRCLGLLGVTHVRRARQELCRAGGAARTRLDGQRLPAAARGLLRHQALAGGLSTVGRALTPR